MAVGWDCTDCGLKGYWIGEGLWDWPQNFESERTPVGLDSRMKQTENSKKIGIKKHYSYFSNLN
ncbi:unnamed protein product [Meloidogyne enterolobii]|uniref:Uncharacterized protein n=1 Tax=Meloidogyne enterolobii TaxID=390850 RepID=A0ACB0XRY5_MELEN